MLPQVQVTGLSKTMDRTVSNVAGHTTPAAGMLRLWGNRMRSEAGRTMGNANDATRQQGGLDGSPAPSVSGTNALAQQVGARIRARREEAGLTQGALAQRLYVARQTVNNWETGKTLPDAPSLVLAARMFDTTVDELLQGAADALTDEAVRARRRLFIYVLIAVIGYLIVVCLIFAQIAIIACANQAFRLTGDLDVYQTLQQYRTVLICLQLAVAVVGLFVERCIRRLMKRAGLRDAMEVAAYLEGASHPHAASGNLLYQWLFDNWTRTRGLVWVIFSLTAVVVLIIGMAG